MTKPLIMGGLMGLMMMWMLHGALTGEGTMGGGALVVFIAAHIVLGALILLAAVFASRLSPRTKALAERLHRPSLRHIAAMLASALFTGAIVHLLAHGGLV